MCIQSSGSTKPYYEGYTSSVEITSLFVYIFISELIHAAIKYPGSCHDSRLSSASGLIHPKLNLQTPSGFAILGESAFSSRITNRKIVQACKTNEITNILIDAALAAIDLIIQRVMPRETQSAECRICALKAPFGILRLPQNTCTPNRYILRSACGRLINPRTRRIRLSHVRTVYANEGVEVQPWIQRLVDERNHFCIERQAVVESSDL